jgi:serine/threonine protein kinase
MFSPAAFVGQNVPALMAGLAEFATPDQFPSEEGQVELYSTLLGEESVTSRSLTLMQSTVPEADLPTNHPDVAVEGVVLEQLLGGGGQGWVYLARVQATGCLIAVKVLRAKGSRAAAAALREATLCARIRHPNVLRVFRSQAAGPFSVVLMELVQGNALNSKGLPASNRRRCFQEVAGALRCLHAHGIIHCDVKPANILLRHRDFTPVLVDFGIAQELADLRPVDGISGTPYFLAPEGFRDQPPNPAWDAYSLGVTTTVVLGCQRPTYTDLPAVRAAKLAGTFDQELCQALDDSPDRKLGAWAQALLDARPAQRLGILAAAGKDW